MIWKIRPDAELLNQNASSNIAGHLGIEVTEIGDDFITARMPVDHRTHQPYGMLHGGASCVLAETLGSVASTYCVDLTKEMAVGLEINANHIRSIKSGYVYGTVRPIHIGRSTQVWDIKIVNEAQQTICVSRLTVAVKTL
jgi:1,4-dihydroxy-2-naphthoyl-CoA hydrolase